jgi:hypothetical protein
MTKERNRIECLEWCSAIDELIKEGLEPATSDGLEIMVRRVLAIEALEKDKPSSYVNLIQTSWKPKPGLLMPPNFDAHVRREAILEHRLEKQRSRLPGSTEGSSSKKHRYKKDKKFDAKGKHDTKEKRAGEKSGAPAK